MQVKYICQGSCRGEVSEAEYAGGVTACATKSCTRHGEPLMKVFCCEKCGRCWAENTTHVCSQL